LLAHKSSTMKTQTPSFPRVLIDLASQTKRRTASHQLGPEGDAFLFPLYDGCG